MGFREATRQNITELPSKEYVSGGKVFFELPKVGLLSKLYLHFTATDTLTAGTGSITASERSPWNLIKRIRLVANSGAAIFDVSGYGCYLINNLLRYGHSPASTLFDRSIGTDVYNLPTTTGTLKFGLEIPIAINDRDAIGYLLLQNNATQLVLEVEFNVAGGSSVEDNMHVLTGNATAVLSASTVGVTMEYFNVPRKSEDYPPLNVVHQWLEQKDSIVSTGTYTKTLLRGNTYMRLLHYITLNAALNTTDVEKLRIIYNQTEVPYTISKMPQLMLQRSRYGMDLPKGTYVHDWYYGNGLVSLGDSRDFINSAAVTEFQTEITIASGATLGSGTNFLNTITEQLIRIA